MFAIVPLFSWFWLVEDVSTHTPKGRTLERLTGRRARGENLEVGMRYTTSYMINAGQRKNKHLLNTY